MRRPAIKPCPFCGAAAKYDEDMGAITCVNTPGGCGFFWGVEGDLAANITHYNTRPGTRSERAKAAALAASVRHGRRLRAMLDRAVELIAAMRQLDCISLECPLYGKDCTFKARECRAAVMKWIAKEVSK